MAILAVVCALLGGIFLVDESSNFLSDVLAAMCLAPLAALAGALLFGPWFNCNGRRQVVQTLF